MVNSQVVNTKGNIGFGRAEVTFLVKKGSAVKAPLSITCASRTEAEP